MWNWNRTVTRSRHIFAVDEHAQVPSVIVYTVSGMDVGKGRTTTLTYIVRGAHDFAGTMVGIRVNIVPCLWSPVAVKGLWKSAGAYSILHAGPRLPIKGVTRMLVFVCHYVEKSIHLLILRCDEFLYLQTDTFVIP